MEIFIVWAVFIHLELKMPLKNMKNNDYCHIELPYNDNNTLKYNHREKSLKEPWVIYAEFTNITTIMPK